jgi:hypothetical protein
VRKQCDACDRPFEAKRASARFCSPACRKRNQRAAAKANLSVVKEGNATIVSVGDFDKLGSLKPSSAGESIGYVEGPIEAATRRQVEGAGRLDTALGLAAIVAARRVDLVGPIESGAGFRALIEVHRSALAEAIKDAATGADPLDQIRAAAALKMIAGGAS